MELEIRRECACNPGKIYANNTTFHKHYQSIRHESYTRDQERSNIYKRNQEMEIEVEKIKRECALWKQKYLELSLKYEKLEDII